MPLACTGLQQCSMFESVNISTSPAAVQVIAYPSKGDGMFVCESLIFRSDSNGEDLEGYAGAGLYDSITLDATETRKVDYGADRCAGL